MEDKIFKALIDKFEHDVLDSLCVEYNYQGKDDMNQEIKYFFDKKIPLGEADEQIRNAIEDEYFSDFEFNEFDEWWKFNGDNYEEEFLKKHPNDKDNMLTIAFDEWVEKHGYDCWENFDDYVSLKKYIEIEIINHSEDKVEFICDIYYKHDLKNGELFKTTKSFFLYEFHFNQMCEYLMKQFNLDIKCTDSYIYHYLPIYQAKIQKIAKKLVF